MDFEISAADKAFQQEVRDFLKKSLPADIARKGQRGFHLPYPDQARWQRILYDKGWAAPGWPVEYGGTGWSLMQRLIFEEECDRAGAPLGNVGTLAMLGPVIYSFGTEAQKKRFLPPMLKGETNWCQGFSEPGSGSDLASLRTRADLVKDPAGRDGDHYVINGSKIWTSNAHQADWIFILVRTNQEVKKQAGISFLLADMKTPGIRVRPLISIDGCHHLNETFYDNVRVPAENLIGGEGQGWSIAKFLLVNERVFGGADLPAIKRFVTRLKRFAAQERKGNTPLVEERSFAQRLAQLELEVLALEMAIMRVIAGGQAGKTGGNALGSILKVRGTELQQRLTELSMEALGDYGPVLYSDPEEPGADAARLPPGPEYAAGVGADFFYRRAATIYGGSNEIQRGIIAKLMFQL
jgi:alkylation response protein AidB-like acyl-CoA dehydrogenase